MASTLPHSCVMFSGLASCYCNLHIRARSVFWLFFSWLNWPPIIVEIYVFNFPGQTFPPSIIRPKPLTVISPYTLCVFVGWHVQWFCRHTLSNQELNHDDRVYLLCKNIGFSVNRFEVTLRIAFLFSFSLRTFVWLGDHGRIVRKYPEARSRSHVQINFFSFWMKKQRKNCLRELCGYRFVTSFWLYKNASRLNSFRSSFLKS